MMDNLSIYSKVAHVPEQARKAISGGRTKGMTDINPMWRIKALTQTFGPCGIGWKYVIKSQRLETLPDGTIKAFVDIDLHIRDPETGEWSEPIPGIGGNTFYSQESSGWYANDECFKSALTDAISVSCKALGVGADVYWSSDPTKYSTLSDGSVWAHCPTPEEEKAQAQLMTVYADERFRPMLDEIVNRHIVEAEAKARLDREAQEEARRKELRARKAEEFRKQEEARIQRKAEAKGAEVTAEEIMGDRTPPGGVNPAKAKHALICYRNSHAGEPEDPIIKQYIEDFDGVFLATWSTAAIIDCYCELVSAGRIEDTASEEGSQ